MRQDCKHCSAPARQSWHLVKCRGRYLKTVLWGHLWWRSKVVAALSAVPDRGTQHQEAVGVLQASRSRVDRMCASRADSRLTPIDHIRRTFGSVDCTICYWGTARDAEQSPPAEAEGSSGIWVLTVDVCRSLADIIPDARALIHGVWDTRLLCALLSIEGVILACPTCKRCGSPWRRLRGSTEAQLQPNKKCVNKHNRMRLAPAVTRSASCAPAAWP